VICVAPRVPGEIVGPRRPEHVVVRPLNFTVRVRTKKPAWRQFRVRRAKAMTLRLRAYLVRARALCEVVNVWFGYRCVCRLCGCG
jgi:hypothetical protein